MLKKYRVLRYLVYPLIGTVQIVGVKKYPGNKVKVAEVSAPATLGTIGDAQPDRADY